MIKSDSIPEFSSSNSITLENIQASSDDVLFATNMGHKWYGNLNSWTDVAIEITKRELTKRGMQITADSAKSLEMAILSARTTSGGWGFRSYVELKVITGDGYTRKFRGEGPSPLLNRSADAAVMRAVTAMLKDDNILNYLGPVNTDVR